MKNLKGLNLAYVRENETHKLLWDLGIQTDHLISARRPDFIIINKKKKKENLQNCGLCCPDWPRGKIGKKMKRRINTSTLQGNWKKTVEHESDVYTYCNWCSWYSHQRISTRTGGLRNKRTSGDRPSIIEIGHNTEKSPGDLRRLAVTQTSVKNLSKSK